MTLNRKRNMYDTSNGKVDIPCDHCGNINTRYVNHPNQKHFFCDRKCKGLWQKEKSTGENSTRWKGGAIYTKEGYRMLNMPSHHRAHQNGYVFEHILVAEKKLGREIKAPAQVHHLNGIRDDNRPENLGLVSPQEHEKWTIKKIYERRIRELEAQLAVKHPK